MTSHFLYSSNQPFLVQLANTHTRTLPVVHNVLATRWAASSASHQNRPQQPCCVLSLARDTRSLSFRFIFGPSVLLTCPRRPNISLCVRQHLISSHCFLLSSVSVSILILTRAPSGSERHGERRLCKLRSVQWHVWWLRGGFPHCSTSLVPTPKPR